MTNIKNDGTENIFSPNVVKNIKDKVLYAAKQTKIRINNKVCDIKDLDFNISKETWEHDYLEMEFTIQNQEVGKYHSYIFSLDNQLEIQLLNYMFCHIYN